MIYNIECVITGNEDRFYVLTPIDIILAQKTTLVDHINWLIVKNKFKVKRYMYFRGTQIP